MYYSHFLNSKNNSFQETLGSIPSIQIENKEKQKTFPSTKKPYNIKIINQHILHKPV